MGSVNSRLGLARKTGQNAARPDGTALQGTTLAPRPETPPIPEARVQKIMRMVESGPALTIRDLATEINLSPSHLQRLFKHHTGVSMGEWLSEQRLQRAADLLAKSYLSVKEIAHTVGYEHPSSFIRAFERRFTQPPARYRKQNECTKS